MAGFASWLFGLPVQQPREYRRLMRIRSRVYTPVARLDAEIIRSAEPIPFDDLDRTAFRPLRPGTRWGKVFDCAWLRITGDVPAGVAEPRRDARHPRRGPRALARRGAPRLGEHRLPAGRSPAQRAVGTGRCATSTRRRATVEFFADVTYNGWILYEVGRAVYHGAHLATRDDEAFALYYDYLTLLVLAGATEDAALAAELRRALARRVRPLHGGRHRAARERPSPPSCRRRRRATSSTAPSATATSTWRGCGRCARPAARPRAPTSAPSTRSTGADDYIYGTSQPQQMQWMKQRHPALYERMKACRRRWPHGAAGLVLGRARHEPAVAGSRSCGRRSSAAGSSQEEFGLTDEQTAALLAARHLRLQRQPAADPARRAGWTGSRPSSSRGTRSTSSRTARFHWQGIDGSTVLVHMPPEGDYNSRGAADNLLTGLQQYPEIATRTRRCSSTAPATAAAARRDPPRGHAARAEPPRPSEGGVLHGRRLLPCASSSARSPTPTSASSTSRPTRARTRRRAQIKSRNRLVERKLHEAEALAVLVGRRQQAACSSRTGATCC